jgi:hypothetical protein
MQTWRYFGRTGGGGSVFEIYRIPANSKLFAEQTPSDVERLRRDGTWQYEPTAVDGIWREVFLGGFSEKDDELSQADVEGLY